MKSYAIGIPMGKGKSEKPVFALGIVVKSPHPPVGGVDLKRKARPAGQRPRIEINEALRQAKCDNKLC
jgi:hypothetical protein